MSNLAFFDRSQDAEFSDANGTISATELSDRVQAVSGQLSAEGLSDKRVCLPLDSSLESLAVLIAVLESGIGAALIAMPAAGEAPMVPPFCDALVMPRQTGSEGDAVTIEHLNSSPSDQPPSTWRGHVWLYTSGSTGKSKWLLQGVKELHKIAHATASRLGFGPQDRVMTTVPIHHSFGLGGGLLSGMVAGASLRMVAGANPLTVFQARRDYQPTAMFMVPSQVRSILALRRKPGRSRVVVVSGDRLLPEEARAFEPDHGAVVCQYGSSETNAMTVSAPEDPIELRHGTAGYALDGVQLLLDGKLDHGLDDDDLVPLRVKTEFSFAGYADPETGLVTEPVPDIRTTGDLVRVHKGDDGHTRIEILGRADHGIKRDGLFVHLGQIESCVAGAEGVATAAVVTTGMTRRGAGLVAFCQLERPGSLTTEAILAHCRENLPARAVPDRLEIIGKLPLLESGKLNRKALTEMAEQQPGPASAAG